MSDSADEATLGTGLSTGRLLRRGLVAACPACGARGQFRWWVRMADRCHRCGLTFERIEGHWIGAIGINTIVSFGILLGSLIVSLVVTFPDFPVAQLMVANIALAIAVPTLFFPVSRTLWTAIDIAMRPLEPHEVDWTVIGRANRRRR
ncbi:MAG: DUF983 domain-containing protein [Actinomycetota bacterium]